MKIDLDHIYLLGWHSNDGRNNISSWQGHNQWIDVVVVGATDNDMKNILWASALHKKFEVILIPALTNKLSFAKLNSGLHGYGWYLSEGIKRPPMRELVDEWAWFDKLKGK